MSSLDSEQATAIPLLLGLCDSARGLLANAASILERHAYDEAPRLVRDDDELDDGCKAAERELERALQHGDASLERIRSTFAMLRIVDHLERIGDYAVTIAKLVELSEGLARDPLVLKRLLDSAAHVDAMFETARSSLEHLDESQAVSLLDADQFVNTANRAVVKQLLDLGADSMLREWSLRMVLVSRCLERAGDHLVDVGEQVAYLATGTFRELSSPKAGGEASRVRREGALDAPIEP
ncbi:MAG: hypothetical protein KDC46_14395 [Thermoleophilia bacterium]|nr:hypothetical protein [Thermoleophilia bacterium]